MLKCDEDDIIKFVQECLCQQYPLSCTTSHISTYLRKVGIYKANKDLLKFLRRYQNTEWECRGKMGRDIYWRFKDGLLD